jgi:hypothetical protein
MYLERAHSVSSITENGVTEWRKVLYFVLWLISSLTDDMVGLDDGSISLQHVLS